jgi:type IV pilus assembly protein PilC
VKVAKAVNGGSSLSDALRSQSKVFPPILIHMVEAGEVGGKLSESLERVADYLENAQELKDRLVGAMVYPGVVLGAATIAVVVVLTFVVPVFSDLFASEGLVLPVSTQVLLAASNATIAYWPFLSLGAVALLFGVMRLMASTRGRRMADKVLIRFPVVGDLYRKAGVARATRAMASMVHSGVILSDTLYASARIAGNTIVEAEFLAARDAIHEGSDLSTPFTTSKVMPRLLGQMVKVGEESGRLDEMLEKVADFFEMEVNAAVEAAMKMLEPAMIIFLGAVLGGIIIAMYAPIFDLMTAMR